MTSYNFAPEVKKIKTCFTFMGTSLHTVMVWKANQINFCKHDLKWS